MDTGSTISLLSIFLLSSSLWPETLGKHRKLSAESKDDTAPEYRIVGGEAVLIAEMPYMLSLHKKSNNYFAGCAATIISEDWGLTAAHCFVDDITSYYVRSGTSLRSSSGRRHNITEGTKHKFFSTTPLDNDIAVFKVSPKFNILTRGGGAIPLANSTPPADSIATVCGWGFEYFRANSNPEQMRRVNVSILPVSDCEWAYPGEINDRMICAGNSRGGKDSCAGDGGGPLVYNGEQIGLVAGGSFCGQRYYPGVYMSIPVLRDWITIKSGVV